jgi:hypothetical protein
LIVDLSDAGPQSTECSAHYLSPEARSHFTQMAVVTGSLLGRVVANLALGSNAPRDATIRLVATEQAALLWLAESSGPASAPRSR